MQQTIRNIRYLLHSNVDLNRIQHDRTTLSLSIKGVKCDDPKKPFTLIIFEDGEQFLVWSINCNTQLEETYPDAETFMKYLPSIIRQLRAENPA